MPASFIKIVSCLLLVPILIPDVSAQDLTEEEISNARQAWFDYYDAIPMLRPITKDTTHVLRVFRVVDPRIPDLNEEEYASLYRQIERDAKRYLDHSVALKEVRRINILTFFDIYTHDIREPQFGYRQAISYLDPARPSDQDYIQSLIQRAVQADSSWAAKVVAPSRSRSVDLRLDLSEQFLDLYHDWRNLRLPYGHTLSKPPYKMTQDPTLWTLVQLLNRDADIFITNSMVAGADAYMPIGIAARGGINAGITANNVHNVYQGTVVVGMLPFLSDDPFFGSRSEMPDDERLNVISMVMPHELGHLLNRIADHDDLEHSVYARSINLDFYQWYRGIISKEQPTPEKWRLLERF